MAANNIKAIETKYKGYRFRSRLEARWAVFFDTLDIEWQYEPEGYNLSEMGYYLPDFWVRLIEETDKNGMFIEIKGQYPEKQAFERLKKLSNMTEARCLMYIGLPGEQQSFICFPNRADGSWFEGIDHPERKGEYLLTPSEFALQYLDFCASKKERTSYPVIDRVGFRDGIRAAKSARFERGETPNLTPLSPQHQSKNAGWQSMREAFS